ncbi:forkhead family transcription factor FKH2 PWA37_002592 [Arxiozyma heterogenica]|uniref:forkhead family transcription factor FKH2 n=1 Tax=Arxiozyma heterogenica TaxID=278026 RepID=UPI002F231C14
MTTNPYYSNRYTAEQHESLINFVISSLDSPNEPTIVSKHYSNDRNMATEVQAYAKISGKDWTYYVKNLEISIGRDTESKFDVLPDLNSNLTHDPNKVDIDLGPAKVVSRKHAIIKYNIQQGYWELHVIGRNGAKVNFRRIPHSVSKSSPPTTIPLQSGTILDIGGTQMIFILPDQIPLLSESALDYLIPKLTRIFGLQPSTNNLLINDLIKSSPYAIQERERLKFEQALQNPLNNNNNGNNNASIAFQNSRNNITDNSDINSSKLIDSNNNNSTSQEFRIFKMYSTVPNNNFNGSNSSGDFNNHQLKYNTLIHSNIPSATTNNNVPYNELSGPTTIVNGDYSYNVVSQSSSEANMKRLTALVESGFPNAMDYATDLSLDENRSVKPPYSYATMITQAILSSKEGVISLSDIYRFISTNYSYYRYTKSGWQNSIRHNLSLNKAFEKVPRRPNEPGKGMKWRVSEKFQKEFLNAWYSGNLSKIKRSSPVSRQLYIHLSKYHRLPGRDENGNLLNPYGETPSTNNINQTNVEGNNINTNTTTNDNNNNNSGTESATNNNSQNVNNPNNNIQQLHTVQITFTANDSNNNTTKTDNATYPLNNEIPNDNVSNTLLNSVDQNQQQQQPQHGQERELFQSQNSKFPQENDTNNHSENQSLQTKDQNIILPKIVMDSNSTSTTSSKSSSNTGNIPTGLMENTNMKNNEISRTEKMNINQVNKENVMETNSNSNSNSNNNNNDHITVTNNSDKLSASNITIPFSGNKLEQTLSSGYDTLLRSPNKGFHISAMEAYTPERGSVINQQETKSPDVSNTAGNSEAPSNNKYDNDTTNNNGSCTPAISSESGLATSANSKKQLLNSNKSSPGVWNLLQFSSTTNTPAIASINSREDNDMNVATFSTSHFDKNNEPAENSKINGTLWASTSFPLRSQSIVTSAATDATTSKETDTKSETSSTGIKSSVNQNRNLILDTENAKLSTVNN